MLFQETQPQGPRLMSRTRAPMTMNGKRILLVEANQVSSRSLSRVLQSAGYSVVKAADGSEAVSTARHEKPDLIVLDPTFPPDVAHGGGVKWDGLLIIEWLHHMQEAMGTPVILISDNGPAEDQQRCVADGVVAVLQKPINNDDLLATIASVLEPAS